MNDQSKPVCTDQAELTDKVNGRRRLVRGAVALAPVVLTLRSGALAAASCTGVKVLNVQTDQNGRFDVPQGSGAAEGDYCATPVQACGVNTSKISGGTIDANPIVTAPNGKLQCGTTGRRKVAILSSAAVASVHG
jgi:hypothetical protein